MNRRLVGLLLALVLAGVATFLLIRVVTTADERAREGEELAQVFVAQGDIPAGTPAADAAAQGLIGTDEIPQRTVPTGAITSLEALDGLVAAGPIFTGEVIIAGRFGETAASPSGLLPIPDDLQAITLDADVVTGVAGFVQAGNTVSVVGTIDLTEDEDTGETQPRTQYLVQNLQVLNVGQRVIVQDVPEEGDQEQIQQSNDRYLFTLAASPEDIERLVFIMQQGTVWFTLVPDGQEPADTEGRDLGSLFD